MPNDHIASDEVGRKRVLNDKNDDSRVFNYRSYNQNDGCSSNTVVKMECIVDEESGSSCKLQGMQYHSKRRQNPVTRSIELWGSEVIQEELLGRTNNDEGAQIDK